MNFLLLKNAYYLKIEFPFFRSKIIFWKFTQNVKIHLTGDEEYYNIKVRQKLLIDNGINLKFF